MKAVWLLGCLLLCGTVQAKSPNEIPERFFELLSSGKTPEAVDFLFDQSRSNVSESNELLRARLKAMRLGEVRAHDLILEELYGAHYTRQVYLLVTTESAARLEFNMSDIGPKWRLNGFDISVGDDIGEKLKEDALRPGFKSLAWLGS
ncbi:hypothetical protein [Pseudoxanthomonas composti]|uniref:DUF3887 domain-containing protein n=1 Tax=Pseudoxanthomonas composti TaxID=2137479 RepID=A0A4Q1K0N7_9GAMM|nr:hypothetical protein [Pseudoxanthomonas composti]RXR08772.1 hypothetical protein EPA99_02875 [Pseudoxanthomonas composti]